MHGFYLQTFAEYGNSPALTLDFVRHLARAMPRQAGDHAGRARWQGRLPARSACAVATRCMAATGAPSELHPGLHFETCYYQGIEYCLREGLTRFEPGAQGRHKIARGFLPTLVRSRHWIADPRFAEAIDAWCAEERAATAPAPASNCRRIRRSAQSPRMSLRIAQTGRRSRARRFRRSITHWPNRTACSPSAAIFAASACSTPIATASSRGSRKMSRSCGGVRLDARCSAPRRVRLSSRVRRSVAQVATGRARRHRVPRRDRGLCARRRGPARTAAPGSPRR